MVLWAGFVFSQNLLIALVTCWCGFRNENFQLITKVIIKNILERGQKKHLQTFEDMNYLCIFVV